MATLHRTSIVLALAAALAGSALADTVVKRNGQKVEGEIIEQTADKVVIKTKFGAMDIPRSDILEIKTGLTSAQMFKQKWDEVDRDDVVALVELGEWCDDNRLSRERKKVYREVIKHEPDHEQVCLERHKDAPGRRGIPKQVQEQVHEQINLERHQGRT